VVGADIRKIITAGDTIFNLDLRIVFLDRGLISASIGSAKENNITLYDSFIWR